MDMMATNRHVFLRIVGEVEMSRDWWIVERAREIAEQPRFSVAATCVFGLATNQKGTTVASILGGGNIEELFRIEEVHGAEGSDGNCKC